MSRQAKKILLACILFSFLVASSSSARAAVTLTSIQVTPSPASVAAGTTQQFAATGTYSDGSKKSITSSVTWSSSNTALATIRSGGLATAVAVGSVTIKATSGSIVGSATLTVTAPLLKSISVTPATVTLVVGSAQQFVATGKYSDGSTAVITSSVSWQSTATSVATVSTSGLALAVAAGAAKVSATSGTITGQANLTVKAPTLESIALSPTTSSAPLGSTVQFTATGTYSNGTTKNLTSSATWKSSSTTVATISTAGLATAVKVGSTTISATSGTVKGSTTLTVTARTLVSIAVTPANSSIPLGTTQQFTATGTYSDGTTQNLTATATWSSSSTAVATISAAGLATSRSVGPTTITATSGSVSGQTGLTILTATLVSISVTPSPKSIPLGTTQQFTATGTYSDGSTQNLTSSASWSSSDMTVASISAGLATSLRTGQATITAASGGVQGQASLTVTSAALVSILITPSNPSIPLGMNQQFTATGTYTDSSVQNLSSSVAWASTSPSVATIGASGLAVSDATGTTNISASLGSVISNSVVLTVQPAVLESIAVTPSTPFFANQTTLQFKATGTYSDGSTEDMTASVTWNCDTPTVAVISTSGLATSDGVGGANVSAVSGAITGSTAITVTPATLVSIAVTPAIPSIPWGTSEQFMATGTFSDNSTQDLTSTVHWTSSNTAAATISNSAGSYGMASSAVSGSTNITATLGSVSGSSTLTVSGADLLSIAVSPATPSIALGTTLQMTATGTYSDSTTKDLTSTAQWSSGATSIAAVGSTGLVQSMSTGPASIQSTLGSVSGMTTLTVTPATLVSITVTPSSASIPLGTTQSFTATGNYSDGTMQNLTGAVHWSTFDPAVATASNAAGTDGVASGVAVGSVTVTAESGSISGTAGLTITPATLVSIGVTPVNPSMPLGFSRQLVATGTYSDATTKDITTNVAWTSSSATVAVVSNNTGSQGLAISSGLGSATMTATMGSVSGVTSLTVGSPQLVSIAVTPANPSIPRGTAQQFTATGTYSDNSTADLTSLVVWSSSNTTTATIGMGGNALGANLGTTNITATSGTVVGSTGLTVIAPVVVGVTVSPTNPTVPLGITAPFTATAVYSDSTTQNVTASAVWGSSNTTVATVSAGSASTLAQGTTSISASFGGQIGSTTLTVGAPAIVSIAVTPNPATVSVGLQVSFTATATYTNQTTGNITNLVSWSSSNTAGATISNTAGTQGQATGVSPGTVTITAQSEGLQGQASLIVSAGYPPLALGVHAGHDNAATSSATVAVNLGTPTAGSVIVCSFSFSAAANFTSVTDNVNSGSYLPAASILPEADYNYFQGIYYHENVAAAATTVTLTYSPAKAHGRMSCAEVMNTPSSYALDSSFVASQQAQAVNPTTGTILTPNNNGELVYALTEEDYGTTTAGSNYTLLDTQTGTSTAQLLPSYWLQTTRTATNAPYNNAVAANYSDQMVAFAPQHAGSCGISEIIDWGAGTNGATPTVADLEASSHGNYPQPNATNSHLDAYTDGKPGQWAVGTTAYKYSSVAYAPLQTTRNCPFYNGNGTTTAQVGLDMPTSSPINSTASETYFDTSSNKTTAWACMMTTAPLSITGTTDVMALWGYNDFANVQWNDFGSYGTWALEVLNGTTIQSTFYWMPNTWYGIRLTYDSGVQHSLSVYSFSSPKCQGTATLMGTINNTAGKTGPAGLLNILTSNANTYPAGYDFYSGAVILDYSYGSTLNP